MFLLQLILIFVVVPAAMILASIATGPAGARLVTYVIFPVGLVIFAVVRHLRRATPEDDEDSPS